MSNRPEEAPRTWGNTLHWATAGYAGTATAKKEDFVPTVAEYGEAMNPHTVVEASTAALLAQQERGLSLENAGDVVRGVTAEMMSGINFLLDDKQKEKTAAQAIEAAYAALDGKFNKDTRVGDKEYHIAKAKARAEALEKHIPGTLGAMMAAENYEMAEKLYQVKFKDKALDFAERLPKATMVAITAAAVAVAAVVTKAMDKIKTWWNEPDFVKKRAAAKQWFADLFTKIAKATEPLRTAMISTARAAGHAVKKGAGKVADGFKAAGAAIAATKAGQAVASAAKKVGTAASRAADKVGKKLRDAGANIKMSVGGAIAKAGQSTEAAGQAHYAKKNSKKSQGTFRSISWNIPRRKRANAGIKKKNVCSKKNSYNVAERSSKT